MKRITTLIMLLLFSVFLISGCKQDRSIGEINLPSNLKNYIEANKDLPDSEILTGNFNQLDLKLKGLSCEGCAYGVEYQLKSLEGVVKAKVKYLDGTALVIYDPEKISKEAIVLASDAYPATIVDDKPFNQQIEIEEERQSELVDEDVHEFNIAAFQWGFEPSTIKVHKNGRVVIYLTSKDVVHGFAIPEYDIVVRIEPGKTIPVSFIADKEGEFIFYCSIPCGEGHNQMKGKLIVE